MFNPLVLRMPQAFERVKTPMHAARPELRHVAFTLFVHDALGWFCDNGALRAVKLACVALPRKSKATQRCESACLKLSRALGHGGRRQLRIGRAALGHGNGTFRLTRQDPAVQAYLLLTEDDADASEGLQAWGVYALAVQVDAAFEHLQSTTTLAWLPAPADPADWRIHSTSRLVCMARRDVLTTEELGPLKRASSASGSRRQSARGGHQCEVHSQGQLGSKSPGSSSSANSGARGRVTLEPCPDFLLAQAALKPSRA